MKDQNTGASNNIISGDVTRTENSVDLDLHEEPRECSNPECLGREEIINKIWAEYCLIKDAAKWFRESGLSMEIPIGGDPVLGVLMAYQDHLGRPLYEDGTPKPEKNTEPESDQVQ